MVERLGLRVRPMSEAEEYLEMSEEAFADTSVEGLSDRGYWNSLYYSSFYAAKAALLSLGFEPKTHSGTDTLVGKILYKDEEFISREEAKLFSQLKTIREEKDYNPEAEIGFDKDSMREKASKLIQKFKEVAE
ncbi:MAG: HEPN domain-containing protein [Candidatus Nanohaloarchaea archaeon]